MRYYIAQPVSLFHSSSCFVSQLPPHTETKKCFLPSFFFFSISLFIYGLWLHGRPKKKPHVCLPYSTGWLCVWYITAAQWYLEERNHQEKSLLVRSQQLHSLLCHRQSLSSSYSRQRNRLSSPLSILGIVGFPHIVTRHFRKRPHLPRPPQQRYQDVSFGSLLNLPIYFSRFFLVFLCSFVCLSFFGAAGLVLAPLDFHLYGT